MNAEAFATSAPLSCGRETRPLWDDFVWRQLTRRSGDREALEAVIAAEPGWSVPRAWLAVSARMYGWVGVDVDAEVAAARAGSARHAWERSLVAVSARHVEEGQWVAKPDWLAHNEAFPADLLGLAVCVFLVTMGTGPDRVARDHERRLRAAVAAVGEHPALLGGLAMGAQEAGELDAAHAYATRSMELDPAGLPGGHPMSHVFFESGDHAEGRAWLDGWLPTTDQDAPFGAHLVWHAALHDLALGDGEGALARYPHVGGSIHGGRLIDGPSLLWRCQLLGHVPAGVDPVTPPVGSTVRPLFDGVPVTFVGMHAALALATVNDTEGLRAFAESARSFDAPGAAELLPRIALGLAGWLEGEPGPAADHLLAMEPHFARYGGSHAQREVLEDTLIRVLIEAGRLDEAATRLQARLDRRENPLDAALLGRVRTG
jgi:hypothetical protein